MLTHKLALQGRPLSANDCSGNLLNLISLCMHFDAYFSFTNKRARLALMLISFLRTKGQGLLCLICTESYNFKWHSRLAKHDLEPRTEKMKKKYLTRIGVSIWNSILLSVKTLKISNFRKKIKSLLLDVLGNEDNYLNFNYLL